MKDSTEKKIFCILFSMLCLLNGILIGMYYYLGELNTSLAWVVTTIWMYLWLHAKEKEQ